MKIGSETGGEKGEVEGGAAWRGGAGGQAEHTASQATVGV